MKVKINKCKDALLWYNKHIGAQFQVIEIEYDFILDPNSNNEISVVKSYWVRTPTTPSTLNFIYREDAEIVE